MYITKLFYYFTIIILQILSQEYNSKMINFTLELYLITLFMKVLSQL